ncbi:hypothetical protein G4H13_47395 [Streptomyces rapamycinicus]|uniref:Uncharacterized protein n=2 Tax=Streptomyces rhizosphaericus TaxID=114699 RepID=A0A6G4AYB0_9ACTN|nr:hypothetical protein [Streptomyces rhizosphaericus]
MCRRCAVSCAPRVRFSDCLYTHADAEHFGCVQYGALQEPAVDGSAFLAAAEAVRRSSGAVNGTLKEQIDLK